MSQLILFTDLDGTLLDHHDYSFSAADEAIAALNRLDIPWILNTSKTLAELKVLRQQLGQQHPVIVENGSGIAIPCDYKHAMWQPPDEPLVEEDGFLFKSLGADRAAILAVLAPLKEQFNFTGFADMSNHELADCCGLTPTAAALARNRLFTEPLQWLDSAAKQQQFMAELNKQGLYTLQGGRFLHVGGSNDKGAAMDWLWNCYQQQGRPRCVALGDSGNDVAMLERADIPVIIRSPDHPPPAIHTQHPSILTEAYGPEGWNQAVLEIIHS